MPEMILYLLKVNIALLLFYAGYRFILQSYTFHTLNRFYMLVGLVYSALYPLIDLNKFLNRNQQLKEQINLLAPDWQGSVTYVINQAENGAGNYWQIVLLIFWTGVIFMSLRLVIQLISLSILHFQSSAFTLENFKFRKISKAVNPFSFWRTIYLNPECHEASELRSILEHEQVHVKQLHTFDVMLAELSTIFYWFNPGVWLMKKAIKANLEFITDEEVIRSGIDSKEYQYALLKSHVLPQNSMPVNNFHFLTIKKRIAMINKKPSRRINLSKYLVLVPAIMLLVLIVGTSKASFNTSVKEIINKLHVVEQLAPTTDIPGTPRDEKPAPKITNLPAQAQIVDTIPATNARTAVGFRIAKLAPDTNRISSTVSVLMGESSNSSSWKSLIQIDTNVTSKPLYVLDGIPMTEGLGKLASERIHSITVLKGSGTTTKYGDKAKDGVILITTKTQAIKEAISSEIDAQKKAEIQNFSLGDITNQMIILDGKEVTKSSLDKLSVTSIESISVVKGSAAVSQYGAKGQNGVIVITTKK